MDCRLEICCADVESVQNAFDGGADRIELCSALEIGGLTPSQGLIQSAVEIMGGDSVNVLIRPRSGDFVYSDAEVEVMERDITHALSLGAGGVVVGALDCRGNIDMATSRRLRDKFPNVTMTFHRAFDLTADADKALEEVIAMGYDRILTSGLAQDAVAGIPTIKRLVERADGRIAIMAGAGVSASNVLDILRATRVGDIHASAKKKVAARCNAAGRSGVSMGTADGDEYSRFVTWPEYVKQLKYTITSYNEND